MSQCKHIDVFYLGGVFDDYDQHLDDDMEKYCVPIPDSKAIKNPDKQAEYKARKAIERAAELQTAAGFGRIRQVCLLDSHDEIVSQTDIPGEFLHDLAVHPVLRRLFAFTGDIYQTVYDAEIAIFGFDVRDVLRVLCAQYLRFGSRDLAVPASLWTQSTGLIDPFELVTKAAARKATTVRQFCEMYKIELPDNSALTLAQAAAEFTAKMQLVRESV